MSAVQAAKNVSLITLGPTGTCHEHATIEYARFQGIEGYDVQLITDFFVGLEMVRQRDDAFLIQCSAHPKVRVDLEISEIDTTWVVYGPSKRFDGDVIGIPSAELYRAPAQL